MNDFIRIAKDNETVQVTTKQGEVFIGTLLPSYFVIVDNGKISAEIYIKQSPTHPNQDFGTVGLSLCDIVSVKLV